MDRAAKSSLRRTLCVAVSALVAAACNSQRGTPDKDLGGLVIAKDEAPHPIDVTRAGHDAAELGRAIAMPHRLVGAAIGAHVATLHSDVEISENGQPVDHLAVDTTIEFAGNGDFHATSNNSSDYGRETVLVGGSLFLRPRYARWHKRAPNDADEPLAIRDSYFAELAGHWELLAPGVDVSDQGATQVAGRNARMISFKRSTSQRKPPAEALAQRAWRQTRTIDDAVGDVTIDATSGAVLAAHLHGQVGFQRDGRHFVMTLDVKQTIDHLGSVPAITAPTDEEIVATPGRQREVEDRDYLLRGIAPTSRAQIETTETDGEPAAHEKPAP